MRDGTSIVLTACFYHGTVLLEIVVEHAFEANAVVNAVVNAVDEAF